MKYPILAMALLLTSCKNIGLVTEPVVVDTFCSQVKVILVSKQDVLTDGTARQILANNRLVDKSCPKK